MNRPTYFELLSDDPGALAAFYRDALGWEIAVLDDPQAYWPITTGPDDAPGINGGLMGKHFDQRVINTLDVTSLDESLARIEAAGGALAHGPNDIPGMGRHAYCTDPDGTLFGLMERRAS